MNIYEFADVIQKDINIKRHHNQDRITVHFDGGEIKDGIMLRSAYGDAVYYTDAINDYSKEISGKLIVFHSEKRAEFKVPILSLILKSDE